MKLPQGWIELPLRDARVLSVRADKCEHVVPGAQNNGACHVAIGPGEDMVYEIALPADEVLSRIAAAQGDAPATAEPEQEPFPFTVEEIIVRHSALLTSMTMGESDAARKRLASVSDALTVIADWLRRQGGNA